jgi:thiamine-phosphate pyrophosphorylase
MSAAQLHDGLYAITDSICTPPATLCAQVEQAISGGARLVQYRDKIASAGERLERARALLALCRSCTVPLIINDDIERAAAIGADGVHLGEQDGSATLARTRLGAAAVIGVSCYNQLERAMQAYEESASYVAFGRFFPSHSKPDARQAPPGLLTEARRRIPLPVVAIGGITPHNGASLIHAGANLLAVIHGVFCNVDTRTAAAQYASLFAAQPPP